MHATRRYPAPPTGAADSAESAHPATAASLDQDRKRGWHAHAGVRSPLCAEPPRGADSNAARAHPLVHRGYRVRMRTRSRRRSPVPARSLRGFRRRPGRRGRLGERARWYDPRAPRSRRDEHACVLHGVKAGRVERQIRRGALHHGHCASLPRHENGNVSTHCRSAVTGARARQGGPRWHTFAGLCTTAHDLIHSEVLEDAHVPAAAETRVEPTAVDR